jgi:hypothetical protein
MTQLLFVLPLVLGSISAVSSRTLRGGFTPLSVSGLFGISILSTTVWLLVLRWSGNERPLAVIGAKYDIAFQAAWILTMLALGDRPLNRFQIAGLAFGALGSVLMSLGD